jgi:cytidylate kinase
MRWPSAELGAIASIVDRQARRWALGLRATEARGPSASAARLHEAVHPYVAISREAGTGGGELGQEVAARLGCPCLHNQLLTSLAEQYCLPPDVLRLVDERASGALYETFRLWVDPRVITVDEYLTRLGQLAALAAHEGSAVFVGRGVQFLLPRARGLAVRVVAPLEQRIRRIMEQRTLDRGAAAEYVREADEGRASLVRQHFHQDVANPLLYDLVVNLEHLGRAAAADLIALAFRRRFAATP